MIGEKLFLPAPRAQTVFESNVHFLTTVANPSDFSKQGIWTFAQDITEWFAVFSSVIVVLIQLFQAIGAVNHEQSPRLYRTTSISGAGWWFPPMCGSIEPQS